MLNRLFLPLILLVLLYGFWLSVEFKVIAAGVAIFLLGMIYLEKGFKTYTGGLLESILKKTTNTVWKSLSFGIITTSVLQSSSLVSVIVISFLSAGLIGLTAGVGIIFGANLGSTTGAWLIALLGLKVNLSAHAMPLLVFGLILNTHNALRLKGMGYILLGVGFLFLGIHYMKEGFDTFKAAMDLTAFKLTGYTGIFVYTLVGMVATVIMQSTSATLLLTFSALAAGQLNYDNALALAIGANIGTTVTAVLGAIGANAAGKRLAIAHLAFNGITAVLAISCMHPLILLVDHVAQAIGIAHDDAILKLALFHTVFNGLGIIVLLPFITPIVTWLNTLFNEPATKAPLNLALADSPAIERAVYLNKAVLSYPDTALRAMTKECSRLFNNTLELICYGIYLSGEKLRTTDDLAALVNHWQRAEQPWSIKGLYQRHIKGIYADIVHYGGALAGQLPQQQAQELFALKVACRNFVRAIKHVKHIYKNMGQYINADNAPIRYQYNQLRLCLASVLKRVDGLGVKRNYEHIREHAEQLKQALRAQDQQTSRALNTLIRSEQVNAYMASSLLNDSAHVHDACTSLINGAVIMLTRDQEEYQEQDLGNL